MGKKIYVGNLPFSVTEETLRQMFAQVGTVENIRIITDRDTGRAKGFAFVEMVKDEDAATAINTLNGKEYEGRALTVAEARPQASQGGGGGGFRGRQGGGGDRRSGDGGSGGGRKRW